MTTLGINDLISADEGETGDLPSLLAAPPLELPPGPADFTGTDKLKKMITQSYLAYLHIFSDLSNRGLFGHFEQSRNTANWSFSWSDYDVVL